MQDIIPILSMTTQIYDYIEKYYNYKNYMLILKLSVIR